MTEEQPAKKLELKRKFKFIKPYTNKTHNGVTVVKSGINNNENTSKQEKDTVLDTKKIALIEKEREKEKEREQEKYKNLNQTKKEKESAIPEEKKVKSEEQLKPKKNFIHNTEKKSEKEDIINKNPAKNRIEKQKLQKSHIFQMLSEDDDLTIRKKNTARNKLKQKTTSKGEHINTEKQKIYRNIKISTEISVEKLSKLISEQSKKVIKELSQLGIKASTNTIIDPDTAELVASSLGHKVTRVKKSTLESILNEFDATNLTPQTRDPIVTIMGHVNHGKTSLLNLLRKSKQIIKEQGDITQNIQAYQIDTHKNNKICILDTPGHAAFQNMRNRGCDITDIIIIIIAADEGIQEQTIESIEESQKANLPIIIAINKIDHPNSNVEKIKNDLLKYNIISEELGGDNMIVPISVKKEENIQELINAVMLQAEMLDLKTYTECAAQGTVIDSYITKGKGVITSIIIERGTLKKGDLAIADISYGKIKNILNDKGEQIKIGLPSQPLQILGLSEPPEAGTKINVLENEKSLREILNYRKNLIKDKLLSYPKRSFNNPFLKEKSIILPVIIKTNSSSLLPSIKNQINKISNDKIKIQVLESGIGNVTESDLKIATTKNIKIIIAFNTQTDNNIISKALKNNINIYEHNIIYELVKNIKDIASDLLPPLIEEVFIGQAEVKNIFNIQGTGNIAGSQVSEGFLERNAKAQVIRNNKIVGTGTLSTIKRFKDNVKEVSEGYECGLAISGYNDFEINDIIKVYKIKETKQEL